MRRRANYSNSGVYRERGRAQARSLADHHIRRLDDRPGVVALLEPELIHGCVGNGRGDDDALADIDLDVRRGRALGHVHNLALELVARAEFHSASPCWPDIIEPF